MRIVTFPRSACWTMNPNCLAVLLARTFSRSSFSFRYSIDLDFRAMSVGCLSPVQGQRNASDPGRLLGRKIYCHQRHVFRFTQPAQRDFCDALFSRRFRIGSLGKRPTGHLCLDHCWTYTIDPNLVLRVVECHRPSQTHYSSLRRTIGSSLPAASDPQIRANVHDGSSTR